MPYKTVPSKAQGPTKYLGENLEDGSGRSKCLEGKVKYYLGIKFVA
jgi:hypothetical protein